MKNIQSAGTYPVHQTVADLFQIKINGKAMVIAFTMYSKRVRGYEAVGYQLQSDAH